MPSSNAEVTLPPSCGALCGADRTVEELGRSYHHPCRQDDLLVGLAVDAAWEEAFGESEIN